MRKTAGVLIYAAYFAVVASCLCAALAFASARSHEAQVARAVHMTTRDAAQTADAESFHLAVETHYRPATGSGPRTASPAI